MHVAEPSLPADLLSIALQRDPAAPLLTQYDDATAERVELSATTLVNWVSKSANLLQDEFDVGPGSTVAVALPAHWQSAAVLLAAWSCGAAVVDAAAEDDETLANADAVVAAHDRLAPLEDAGVQQLLGLSLHPFGLGMPDYRGPARDFALEVRVQGDRFVPYGQPDPAQPGLLLGGLTLTLGALVTTATELANRLGMGAEDRVLIDAWIAEEAGPVAWLLAPLAAGASIVLCRNALVEALPRRVEAERVTATFGPVLAGIRRLGGRPDAAPLHGGPGTASSPTG